MTTPDEDLAARLAETFHNAYERLAPSFGYETREDTKTFSPDSQNGKLMIATCADILSSNQLITTADADARVKAAVLAEREAAKSMVWTLGHEIKASMLVDEDNERAVLDMVKATAAAILSCGVTG